MERVKIISVEEMNMHADERTACNGGGYFQPATEFAYGELRGSLYDSSCGDFGSRYEITLGGKSAQWGSMYSSDEEYSDFTEEDENFLSEVERVFGITVPINL